MITLIILQFTTIFVSSIPIFNSIFLLFNIWCYLSSIIDCTRYNIYFVRSENDETIFFDSVFNIYDKKFRNKYKGYYHFKLRGIRSDVKIQSGGNVYFDMDIPSDKYPFYLCFDVFVSPTKPIENVIKNNYCRPIFIDLINSSIFFHQKNFNKDKEKTSMFGFFCKTTPITSPKNIYYTFQINPLHEVDNYKVGSKKIKEKIKNYVESENFLRKWF